MNLAKSICIATLVVNIAIAGSDNAKDDKTEFAHKVSVIVQKQNELILNERQFIEAFFANHDKTPNAIKSKDFSTLLTLAAKYKINDIFYKEEYLEKIDVIPPSLALSQAVLESGWGESSVAKRSKNFFGQRKFNTQKDLTVASYSKFKNIDDAVKAYMANLNSHSAYKEFREKRLSCSINRQKFDGIIAAKTLKNYSEDGGYSKALVSIINKHFAMHDGKHLKSQLKTYM